MIDAIAVLDASVLYPAPLRDTLAHLAVYKAYKLRVSQKIHDEWINALLHNRPELSLQKLERTCDLINNIHPQVLVTNYESLIEEITLPDADDCHVLAAAIKCNASVIITNNLKHFPEQVTSTYNIKALSPDKFICKLIDEDAGLVCQAIKEQRSQLRNPPKSVQELLETLYKQGLVATTQELYKHTSQL